MKIENLIILVVSGVILADLVAHVAGTKALFSGFHILWDIATEPTDTNLLSTTMANTKPASGSGTTKKA